MITRKGLFYLLCFLGYMVILFSGIPVLFDRAISHISLIPHTKYNNIDQAFIDYTRLALYLVMWPVLCFLVYHISKEVTLKKMLK